VEHERHGSPPHATGPEMGIGIADIGRERIRPEALASHAHEAPSEMLDPLTCLEMDR
jgi:hypothetical protein